MHLLFSFFLKKGLNGVQRIHFCDNSKTVFSNVCVKYLSVFETQAELANLPNSLPNLPNLPKSVKIKNSLSIPFEFYFLLKCLKTKLRTFGAQV